MQATMGTYVLHEHTFPVKGNVSHDGKMVASIEARRAVPAAASAGGPGGREASPYAGTVIQPVFGAWSTHEAEQGPPPW